MQIDVESVSIAGFEKVFIFTNSALGLKAILALHSTAMGVPVVSCKMREYILFLDAFSDALEVAKTTTMRNGLFDRPWGGAALVVVGNPKRHKQKAFFDSIRKAMPEVLHDAIFAAESGIDDTDLASLSGPTSREEALPTHAAIAWGTFQGLLVGHRMQFGTPVIRGRRIFVHGIGPVGLLYIRHLVNAGAIVSCTDLESFRLNAIPVDWDVSIIPYNEIYKHSFDVFSPCRAAVKVNLEGMQRISAKLIVGAASQQLRADDEAVRLHQKEILCIPDFCVNAGGILNAMSLRGDEYEAEKAVADLSEIGETLFSVLLKSDAESVPPITAAKKIALQNLERRGLDCNNEQLRELS